MLAPGAAMKALAAKAAGYASLRLKQPAVLGELLIGLVLQEIYLFPGTVLDNLRVLDETVAPERVEAAVYLALGREVLRPEVLRAALDGVDPQEDGDARAAVAAGEKRLADLDRAIARLLEAIEAGGVAVGDEVKITLNVELIRK